MCINFQKLIKEERYSQTINYIKSRINTLPKISIILGSGLGIIENQINEKISVDMKDIPYYPVPTVSGHQGKIVFGKMGNKNVMAIFGRSHYYEGIGLEKVVLPILLLYKLDIKKVIITNAAGAVNPNFRIGDLVLLNGYINFTQLNIFKNNWEKSIQNPFSLSLNNKIVQSNLPVKPKTGTYCWTTGPSYESPAEVKFIRYLGGDLVGMSTIPEAFMAKRLGLDVIGISFVSNLAVGLTEKPLSHEEVKKSVLSNKENFSIFIYKVVTEIL